MTTENRPGIPVPSSTVEYGGMRIEKGKPGGIVYGSKDIIYDDSTDCIVVPVDSSTLVEPYDGAQSTVRKARIPVAPQFTHLLKDGINPEHVEGTQGDGFPIQEGTIARRIPF